MTTTIIEIDEYKPDYKHRCENCGADHVVTGVKAGKVVYQGTIAGFAPGARVTCVIQRSGMYDH